MTTTPYLRVSSRRALAEFGLWTLICAAVTADATTTLIAVWAGAPETNPLLAPLVNLSPSLILAVKAGQLAAAFVVWRATNPRGRPWVLAAGATLQLGIVGLNLATIAAAA